MLRNLFRYLVSLELVLSLGFFAFAASPAQALTAAILGVHVLNPTDLDDAKAMIDINPAAQEWHYVTIPLTQGDLKKPEEWQKFFDLAKTQRVIPIIRLATRYDSASDSWQIPSRRDVIEMTRFLSSLSWPTDQKNVIVFNEVNHAKEWGNNLDPAGYTQILRFTADWLHSEEKNYVVLPAAMDLAAPNSAVTKDAFSYLEAMLAEDSTIFDHIDVWNSHSYPNPGFSSSPTRVAVNSLRGFWFELEFIKNRTGKDFKVFITETGWADSVTTRRWLTDYYTYALQHVWSDPRVVAVTPFVLKGDPGPFADFGFLDRNNQPTRQYKALQKALTISAGT